MAQFRSFTGANGKTAEACLAAHGWNLSEAANAYFEHPAPYQRHEAPMVNVGKIEAAFKEYENETGIEVEGMIRLCQALELDPSDPVLLVVAHRFGAKRACFFSREEFVGGMTTLECESVAALKAKLPPVEYVKHVEDVEYVVYIDDEEHLFYFFELVYL